MPRRPLRRGMVGLFRYRFCVVSELSPPVYKVGPLRNSGRLAVGEQHQVYFEETGNPDGVPLVVVHGGPGAGMSNASRGHVDPAHFRVICLDQRGAGRSVPTGLLTTNTTWHLVSDMEVLRHHLAIDRWIVCGGSWGATLALVYAISHPTVCAGLLLRSVPLGLRSEIDWWAEGIRRFFPEHWRRFAAHAETSGVDDLLPAYFALLTDEREHVRLAAAVEWHRYEGMCNTFMPSSPEKLATARARDLVASAQISAHYFLNAVFLEEGWILDNIQAIAHLPVAIIHGRYDIICPVESAFALHKALPHSTLAIVADAGHSSAEPQLSAALQSAIDGAKNWPTGPKAHPGGEVLNNSVSMENKEPVN